MVAAKSPHLAQQAMLTQTALAVQYLPDGNAQMSAWGTYIRKCIGYKTDPEQVVQALNNGLEPRVQHDCVYIGDSCEGWHCPEGSANAGHPRACTYSEDYDQCDSCGHPEERK